ncbi:MAG TPA: HAMP domain-containing sensor histidine kinase, partial [Cyclobacteriaceae bacterium]
TIVSVVLLASFTSVYFLYADFRQEDFYNRLRDKCLTTYKLLIEVEEIDDKLLQILDKNTLNVVQNEKVLIFDPQNKIIYSNIADKRITYSVAMLDKIRKHGEIRTTEGGSEVYGTLIREKKVHTYVVLASAYDTIGKQKLENLKLIMSSTLIIGLMFTGVISFFYASKVVNPLETLNLQVQRVSENNLNEKVTVGRGNDEINSLARNFNHMLDRIENAFAIQKSFVQHASHELRTPIASMIAQTESALSKELSVDNYKALLNSLLEDQQELADLSNALLLLSKYEQVEFTKEWPMVRIDEVIYKSIDTIQAIYTGHTIKFDFVHIPENENVLSIPAHEVLLQSAFHNLIKNACQYSDDQMIQVQMNFSKEQVEIEVRNHGDTLAQEEIAQLFTPFFRGQNASLKKGFGLGLSICYRILTIHKGTIAYTIPAPKINCMRVVLPRKI